MAPEILLKNCYNPSADLWSIGVILYECLFGQAPYRSKSIEELMRKIVAKQKIDIPKTAALSASCQNLLVRLLVHEPKNRISFDDFFGHEFLDLQHEPTDEVHPCICLQNVHFLLFVCSQNLTKAIELFTKAVELDHQLKHMDAYQLYCEGLQYFVPLIEAESDSTKKHQLRDRANTYLKRAEEIKSNCMHASTARTRSVSRQHSAVAAADSNCTAKTAAQVTVSTPISLYTQLCNLTIRHFAYEELVIG